MYSKLFQAVSGAFVALVSQRVLDAVTSMVDGASSLSKEEAIHVERSINSQALAAAIFVRWGVSGLASAYHFGVISVADFAAYVVVNESYRLPATSVSRIQQLEAQANESGFVETILSTPSDFAKLTTDPTITQQMYTYLLNATQQ